MYQIKPTNKQNFFSKNSSKIIAVFVVILLVIVTFNLSETARSLVPNALLPFFKTGDFFYGSLEKMPKFFSDRVKLAEENQNLLEQLENNKIRIADYDAINYENQKLREELRLKPLREFTSAAVLARSPQIPLDSLLIDKGGQDGLKPGDFVFSGERVLIGKIAKAYKSSATVTLNSFAGLVSYGYLERTSEPVEIKGDGGGSIEAKLPIDFDIVVGDKIMANGSGAYLSAVVGKIEEDKSSGFKEIFMSLPVDVSKTNIVFIEPAAGE